MPESVCGGKGGLATCSAWTHWPVGLCLPLPRPSTRSFLSFTHGGDGIMSHAHSSNSSNNIVGVHYRVGKKIGEGSFGVIFEGTSLDSLPIRSPTTSLAPCRNQSAQLADRCHQICAHTHPTLPPQQSLIDTAPTGT